MTTQRKKITKQPLINRVKAQVSIEEDCWIWTGYKNKKSSVPMINYTPADGGKSYSVGVRRALMLDAGRSLKNTDLCKAKCGNDLCVNPAHTIVVTAKANMVKMNKAQAGTLFKSLTSAKRFSKLTKEQVREIMSRTGERPENLAKEYGVSATHIRRLQTGRHWIDLSDPYSVMVASLMRL